MKTEYRIWCYHSLLLHRSRWLIYCWCWFEKRKQKTLYWNKTWSVRGFGYGCMPCCSRSISNQYLHSLIVAFHHWIGWTVSQNISFVGKMNNENRKDCFIKLFKTFIRYIWQNYYADIIWMFLVNSDDCTVESLSHHISVFVLYSIWNNIIQFSYTFSCLWYQIIILLSGQYCRILRFLSLL